MRWAIALSMGVLLLASGCKGAGKKTPGNTPSSPESGDTAGSKITEKKFVLRGHTTGPELIFRSGFEPNTRIHSQTAKDARISGTDLSVQAPANWKEDLEGHPRIGYVNIQYQGGTPDQRLAEILPGPVDPANRVLQFRIREPNVDDERGRVQANIYENNKIGALSYSVRLFIPDSFTHLRTAPFSIYWLTLMEFWNNANWTGEGYPFRISVNLRKTPTPGAPFTVELKSQVMDTKTNRWEDPPIWVSVNEDYAVPVGQWLTLNIRLEEGDVNTGYFELSITPDGGETTVVHRVSNTTHHPLDPAPNGIGHFNPMKLYTSRKVLEYMANEGQLLHLYWDDFSLSVTELAQ